MNEKKIQELTNDVLIADAMIRLKSLETLLISKGIFTEEEFKIQMKDITELITLTILQKSNVSGDLNKIIENLK